MIAMRYRKKRFRGSDRKGLCLKRPLPQQLKVPRLVTSTANTDQMAVSGCGQLATSFTREEGMVA